MRRTRKNSESKVKALLKDVESFIERQSLCDENSGWPKVDAKDWVVLSLIIGRLIALKWQDDCDGDRPVEFKLRDRTKYESGWELALPYLHKAKTEAEEQEILSRAMTNAHSAMERLNRLFLGVEFQRQERKQRAG